MSTETQQATSPSTPANWRDQNEGNIVLYQALTERVGHRDALLWQSPALAMTAQAFLLVIALGHDTGAVARVLASVLGLFVTFMSIQLMLKHRLYLSNDMAVMVALERRMGLPSSAIDYATQLAFLRQDMSEPLLIERAIRKRRLTLFTSVHIWVVGLCLFALVNVLLLYFAIPDAFGVPCPWVVQPDVGPAGCVLAL